MANNISFKLFNFTLDAHADFATQNEGVPLVINVIDENGVTKVHSQITPITKPTSIPPSSCIKDTGPAGAKQVEIVAMGPLNISGIDVVVGVVPK